MTDPPAPARQRARRPVPRRARPPRPAGPGEAEIHALDRDARQDDRHRSTARTPTDETGLGFRTVLSEPFVAVLPSTHPLATQRTVQLAQLADSPFVLLPRTVGPPLHDQIIGLCTAAGFTPQVVQHAVEWQTVCALVETGLGVSLAPASIRRIRLKGVAFRRIEPGTARTRVAVAWRENDHDPLVTRLLATISQDPPDRS